MNEYTWDDEDSEDSFEESEPSQKSLPANLRKLIREKDKQSKILTEENARLHAELLERDRSQILTSRGIPAKVAKLIPSTVTDVDAWLHEFGDVLPVKGEPTETAAPVPDDDMQNMLKMQETSRSAAPDVSVLQTQLGKLANPELAEDEFRKMLKNAGARLT